MNETTKISEILRGNYEKVYVNIEIYNDEKFFRINLTDDQKQLCNVICSIYNKMSGKMYFIGTQRLRTYATNFASRISIKYNDGSYKHNTRLLREIRRNPKNFSFNVEYQCSDFWTIRQRQTDFIRIARAAGIPLYNINSGSGTENAILSSPKIRRSLIKGIHAEIKKSTRDALPFPEFSATIRRKPDVPLEFEFENFPENAKDLKNVIYLWTDAKGTPLYIGKTNQNLAERAGQHLEAAQEINEDSLPLQRAIHANPDNIRMKIIYRASSWLTVEAREALLIKKYSPLFNRQSGTLVAQEWANHSSPKIAKLCAAHIKKGHFGCVNRKLFTTLPTT